MVKASDSIPYRQDGTVDVALWLAGACAGFEQDSAVITRSLELICAMPSRVEEFLEKGIELANLVLTLNMDAPSVAAALLYRPVRTGSLSVETIRDSLPATDAVEVAGLVDSVVRMADTSLLEMSNSRMQTSESRDQVENIKRMLISMVDDARVAVLKLAERVVALRAAKASSTERQLRIAQEAHQVFAPLANRLGVWQLKWELEDLSLRYLAPDIYKAIASQLKGRRVEREKEIQDIVDVMEARLLEKRIDARVFGRAKHIFSIWRKMRAKSVGLNEVYDVRAIRVVVPDISQCYSALGVIHTEWQHIPSEFDDYIAVPKENGYRSIHTAVSWSDGKTLEVQIRTPEMHEEAELGVCAHWAYKDGVSEDDSYTRKLDWMRQVVEWQEEAQEHIRQHQIGLELGHRVLEERIFVYTPKGHVLDLITGATALDFAYRVHTEVGHRCRGARVDGHPVALNRPLQSGQRVEILTAEDEGPRRAWLHQHLDCIRTTRAREKIADWFHDRPDADNLAEGRRLLEHSLNRLARPASPAVELAEACARLGYEDVESCLIELGAGDCQIVDLLAELLPADLLAPGDSAQPTQMSLLDDEPAVPGAAAQQSFLVEVVADDRTGLLMDITTFLRSRNIMLLSNSGRAIPETGDARIVIEIRLGGLLELYSLLDALELIPAIRTARLIENQDSRNQGVNI